MSCRVPNWYRPNVNTLATRNPSIPLIYQGNRPSGPFQLPKQYEHENQNKPQYVNVSESERDVDLCVGDRIGPIERLSQLLNGHRVSDAHS
jgi:hypothetical protein